MNGLPQAELTTQVTFADDARKALFEGLEVVAKAVSCTLGPRGKTVLIQRQGEGPIVTKDGVTVSKSIRLKDPAKRMGAELIREAASRTNDVAGDGTTTATVLTHSMVKSGLRLLGAGYPANELKSGIERAVEGVTAILKANARKVTTPEEVAQVATISANGDDKIGELIAAAMQKVGNDGIITVEDAKGMSTTLDVVEGMQIDRGYLSPYFVTNNERMSASYADAAVLVTDRKLASLREIVPVLELCLRENLPLLIIAEDVEGEALQGLVLNRVKSGLRVVAIKAPGYGTHRDELLRDICILTGAQLVSPSEGRSLEKVTRGDLGRCKKFITDAKTTTLVGTGDTKEKVDIHVTDLKSQLQDVTLGVDSMTKLKARIAKLSSGVAVIKVGGATEVEMIERKYRIEDALNATRAAVEEGIVPGGGSALFDAGLSIKHAVEQAADMSEAEKRGASIVVDACHAPLRKIAENAGKSPDVVFDKLNRQRLMSDIQFPGYDAATDAVRDMYVAGIIDPVKVTRTALQNATSVATTFLSLDALITDEEGSQQ